MTSTMWRRSSSTAALLLALPVVADLVVSGRTAAIRYVAADAFYYFTVARNVVDFGRFSFDQTAATNGFHPLWQLTLVPLFAILGDSTAVTASLIVGLAALVAALLVLGRILRDGDRLHPSFALVPLGGVALALAPMWLGLGVEGVVAESPAETGRPLYATMWSYVNGMESAFVVMFFALAGAVFVHVDTRRGGWRAVALGVCLAGVGLSRLDHMLLPLFVLGWMAVRWRRDPGGPKAVAIALVTFAVLTGSYVVSNVIAFGSPVPVSGASKSTFPIWGRLDYYAFRALLSGDWPGLGAAARVSQSVVPALGVGVACVFWWFRRRRLAPIDEYLALGGLVVLALGAYNFLFVPLFSQGHWYYPMSTVWLSCVLVREATVRSARPLVMPWLMGAAVLSLATFVGLHRSTSYHAEFVEFQENEAPRILAHYGAERPRLLAMEDGLIAFATGLPTMSGTGLALDADASAARSEGRMLHHAVARGHDRIASVQYVRHGPIDRPLGASVGDIDALREPIVQHFGERAIADFDFVLDYVSPARTFVIVRAVPR